MRRRIALALTLVSLQAAGCAPRVFSDGAQIRIVGSAPPPPEPAPEPVAMPEFIELPEKVRFAQNSARILGESHAMLDEVAKRIVDTPQIRRIRVEGHASADGNDAHNMDLSSRRATAVMDYLVGAGVDAERLEAEGYGETRPIADNETREGRETNRRVELHILEQDGAPAAT